MGFNRLLSAGEINRLHQDPFQLLVFPQDVVLAQLVGVGAAGPAISCQHTMMTMGIGCAIWASEKIDENPILTRRELLTLK
jgi:hypothetical protein